MHKTTIRVQYEISDETIKQELADYLQQAMVSFMDQHCYNGMITKSTIEGDEIVLEVIDTPFDGLETHPETMD